MDLVSTCPLRAASLVWVPAPGRWALTVVCKATYRLTPGESPLDVEQDEPNEEDNYWDDDPDRSLYSPADLIPFKQRADVVLVGHAFAPGGAPVRSIMTRLIVGDIDKSIEAFCDRSFTQDGQLRQGPKVTKVSLRYERAAGGPSTSNPTGVRLDMPDLYGVIHLPSLQPQGVHITSRGDFIEPIGYGPIAPAWPSRFNKLRPYNGTWNHAIWRDEPLPEGFDPAIFNVAPADQQVSSLRDNERIVLENLHPEHPRLVTSLCGIRPTALVRRDGLKPELVAMLPDTLWIDTTRGVCTLVWRGLIHLQSRDEAGQVVISVEDPRRADAGFREVEGGAPVTREDAEDAVSVTETIDPEPRVMAPNDPDAAVTMPLRMGGPSRAPVMPFVAGPREPATSSTQVETRLHPAIANSSGDTITTTGEAWQLVRIAPPESDPPRLAALPPAPAMIGPLATPEMVVPRTEPPPPPANAAAPAAIAKPAELPPEPAVVDLPIEKCAAIAASIARRKADTGRILEEHEIKQEDWTALERRWADAIRKETDRGKTALLMVYDAAYVAQLEKERGPIVVDEYARLVVASERGNAGDVLAELTLPRGAMMRIERVWLSRIADDAALAGTIRKAIEAARQD